MLLLLSQGTWKRQLSQMHRPGDTKPRATNYMYMWSMQSIPHQRGTITLRRVMITAQSYSPTGPRPMTGNGCFTWQIILKTSQSSPSLNCKRFVASMKCVLSFIPDDALHSQYCSPTLQVVQGDQRLQIRQGRSEISFDSLRVFHNGIRYVELFDR